MRRLLLWMVMLGLLSAMCRPGPSTPPNIVFVLIDALRQDHLGAYGYGRDTTPFIDELGREGLLFEHAVAQSPWTGASMASMWTSRYPSEVGGVVEPDSSGIHKLGTTGVARMRPDTPTLAERLTDAGYQTIAVVANPYAGDLVGVLRGFTVKFQSALPAGELTDKALELLSEHLEESGPQPFFLYVHYLDVHAPTRPPAPYDARYPPLDGAPHDPSHAFWKHERADGPDAPEVRAFRSHKIALYDGALAYIDDQIRRVSDDLTSRGLQDETVFVVASDHGEAFWEHGAFAREVSLDPRGAISVGHGHSMFGELLDVPMVLSGPGIPAGRVSTPVRCLDLTPTLLGLGRTSSSAGSFRGIDLLAAHRSETLESLPAFSENIAYGVEAKSLQQGRYKLIRHTRTQTAQTEFLFDRQADPREQQDLLESEPAVAATLRQLLDSTLAHLEQHGEDPVIVDRPAEEQLRAIGYLE